MAYHPLLMSVVTIAVVVANALWFKAKFDLRREGKEVSWFVDHHRDFRLLREVIAETESASRRRHFQTLLRALQWAVGVVLTLFGLVVIGFFVAAI